MASHTVPPGAQPLTRMPLVQFSVTDVPPPTGLLVGVNDQLALNVYTTVGATIIVQVRLLNPDGSITPQEWDFTPPSDGTLHQNINNLYDGFLLSAVAWINNTGAYRGTTYAQLILFRGGIVQNFVGEVLSQGYITTNTFLSYPAGIQSFSNDGRGALRTIQNTITPAGSDWIEQVPLGRTWRLMGVRARLVTSATVATRSVVFNITDSASRLVMIVLPQVTQAASLTIDYTLKDTGFVGNSNPAIADVPMPSEVYMGPNAAIQSVTTNLQATDQWTIFATYAEEWLTP